MKFAAGDFVWLIIAIVFGIAKMWSKFASSQPDEDEETLATPPVQPRPRPQPLPARRAVERRVPVPAKPITESTWEAAPKDLREFMDRLTRGAQSKPAVPPPVLPPPPSVPKHAPKPAPPVAQPAAAKPAPVPATQANPWVEALRDRKNLRNIIIANEIIGSPRGA